MLQVNERTCDSEEVYDLCFGKVESRVSRLAARKASPR